jgi:periplasmic protein TonB
MAYSDIDQLRPTPKSLGVTLLINGLILTGIAFIAPNVKQIVADPATGLINIFTPTPVPIDEHPVTIKDENPRNPSTPDPTPTPPIQASKGSGASSEFVVPLLPPIQPGGGETFIQDPPQPLLIVEPVLKPAKLNPRYAGALQPEYPPGMIREEKEGAVTIKVLIGVDGRVKQVEPIRFDEDAFLAATRKQALSSWRFLPATKDGEPVESWKEMTVRFQMPSG